MRSLVVMGMMLCLLPLGCTPAATDAGSAAGAAGVCASTPAPKVVIVDFDNTSGSYGITVAGLETAATARLITLLENSGCYQVLERSVLQELIATRGLESTAPAEIARAAGAAYAITGTVTEVSIEQPRLGLFGVVIGSVMASVAMDVRATDAITGQVVVSMTGRGSSQSANLALTALPIGPITLEDSEVGPLLADASETAIGEVVAAIRRRF